MLPKRFVPLFLLLSAAIFISAEIPAVPRCPLNLNALRPCICGNPLVRGLRITCSNINLPQLAKRCQLLSGAQVAVFEVNGGSLRTWDRHLLGNITVLEVMLRDVGLRSVDARALGDNVGLVTRFSLPHNQLDEVPAIIPSLRALKILDLSFNKLRTIPGHIYEDLPLEEINLAGNLLQDLTAKAFHGLPKLSSLSLAFNQLRTIGDLGFDYGHNLRVLNTSGNLITSVGPNELRNLSNLDVLDLSFNQITTLDEAAIRGLTRLTYILLDHNKIVEIPPDFFSMGMSIKNVSLSYNQMETLPTETLGNLYYIEELLLDHNKFTSIPKNFIANRYHLDALNMSWNPIMTIEANALDGLKNITMIDLSHCKISVIKSMGIGDLMGLQALYLNDNEIDHIDADSLGFLPSVQSLDLSRNKITTLKSLQIAKMIGVMTLNVAHNFIHGIKSVDVPKLSMLMHLDLSFNGLKDLAPGCFKDFLSLMSLKLSDNNLRSVDGGTLGTINLLELDLSNNNITALQRFAFRGLRAIRKVVLDNNFIPELFQIPVTLGYISARNNSIDEIKRWAFPRANSLSYLDVSFNNISSIESGGLQMLIILQTLCLRGNQLKAVPKAELQNRVTLQTLDLGQNQITTVDFDAFTGLRLRNLSLDNNLISVFNESALKGLAEVLELRINGNQLTQLDPQLLKGLQSTLMVDLGENNIRDLPTDSFWDLYSVQQLGLSGNKLQSFPRKLFERNAYLKEIDFSRNQIRALPSYIDENSPRGLRKLNFSGNYLQEMLGTPNLPSVETLDLSHNMFQHLNLKSISKFSGLKTLLLNDNPMELLSDATLTCDLDYLSLDRTLLHTVPFSLIQMLNQENSTLSFTNMSLHCDCRIVGLQEFLRTKQNTSQVTCSSPKEMNNTLVLRAVLPEECERPRLAATKFLEDKSVLDLQASRMGGAVVLSWETKIPVDIFSFGLSIVYENRSVQAPKTQIPYYVNSYSVEDLSFSKNYRACVQAFDTNRKQVGSSMCKLVNLASLESSNAERLTKLSWSSILIGLALLNMLLLLI